MNDPATRHLAIFIPRRARRPPLVLSVAPVWAWIGGALIAGLLVAALVAVLTYADAMRKLREYENLTVEVEALRQQNQVVRQLEQELGELRRLQQRMLHLAGIRATLEAGASLPLDLPGEETGPLGEGALVIWPVEGRVLRGFQEGHPGVDLAAPRKRSVMAAGGGVVIEAGKDPELGLRVVLEHGDSLRTVYAGNHVNLVAPGDTVEAGQVIALVGMTAEGTEPHLHFEVWQGNRPLRPEDAIVDPFRTAAGPENE